MKIIKNIISIGLIILLSFINSTYAEKEKLREEELLIKTFEETGANFVNLNLNFNGIINEVYKDEQELQAMMQDILDELDLTELEINPNQEEEYLSSHTESFSSTHIFAHGKDKDEKSVTIILYSYLDKEINNAETSIVVDITVDESYAEIDKIIKKVNKLYEKFNIKTEFTYCIIGAFEGELNKSEMIKKITRALSVANGNRVEGLIEDIVSISAYSPNLDKILYTGNKKMNLNIALSYNEYEGKTYITMGYPIITIGY